MAEPLRLLVVGAHPADIFDQSAGTMAHHVSRGDWVGCVVLTHEARIHDKVISEEMFGRTFVPDRDELQQLIAQRSDVKALETLAACRLIGLKDQDVLFFGADDAVLQPTEENVRRLARVFRELKPHQLITHFPREHGGTWNPHSAAGEIVLLARELAAGVDPGDRNPPHKVAQIFFFGAGAAAARSGVFGADGGFTNDLFIDITDVAHLKIQCLDALKSQGYGGAYARKRIETNDGAFGAQARVSYAEGFIRWRSETHRHLPLTDLDREQSSLSDHAVIARMSHKIDPGKLG